MKEYFDLGKYSRKVTTNELAQIWFNRGMVWLFAYNHEESILCFEKVIELDKNCAFAYWGIAYAIGPNYNKPWDIFTSEEKIPTLKKAHECISKANKISDLSKLESQMLKALEQRYPKNPDIEKIIFFISLCSYFCYAYDLLRFPSGFFLLCLRFFTCGCKT